MFPSYLNALAARELTAERERAARRRRRAQASSPEPGGRAPARLWRLSRRGRIDPGQPLPSASVTIRLSYPDDAGELARLAALDESPLPAGRMLVAEVEGTPRAALPLSGGPAIADPFYPSAGLVSLLELRAAQLGTDDEGASGHPLPAGGGCPPVRAAAGLSR